MTGASGGIGRATAQAFARPGACIALLARGEKGLEAARKEVEARGAEALVLPTDVADETQVEAAAAAVEAKWGRIDVWVNNAMATIFGPVSSLNGDQIKRATEVTYLGAVYGTLAALSACDERDRGVIVQVGSALAYRGIPLASAVLRREACTAWLHRFIALRVAARSQQRASHEVHLSAFNTPQFDWALNLVGKRPMPVPPIFQPELAARRDRVGVATPATRSVRRLAGGESGRRQQDHAGCARSDAGEARATQGQITSEPLPADACSNSLRALRYESRRARPLRSRSACRQRAVVAHDTSRLSRRRDSGRRMSRCRCTRTAEVSLVPRLGRFHIGTKRCSSRSARRLLIVLGGIAGDGDLLLSGAYSTAATKQHFWITYRMLGSWACAIRWQRPPMTSLSPISSGSRSRRRTCVLSTNIACSATARRALPPEVPRSLVNCRPRAACRSPRASGRKRISSMSCRKAFACRACRRGNTESPRMRCGRLSLSQSDAVSNTRDRTSAWRSASADSAMSEARRRLSPIRSEAAQITLASICVRHLSHDRRTWSGLTTHVGPPLDTAGTDASSLRGVLPNTHENLVRWIMRSAGDQSAHSLMPNLDVTRSARAYDGAILLQTRVNSAVMRQRSTCYVSHRSRSRRSQACTHERDYQPRVHRAMLNAEKPCSRVYECGACHVISGIPGAVGRAGPALDGLCASSLCRRQVPERT